MRASPLCLALLCTLAGCAGAGSTFGGGDLEVAVSDPSGLLLETKRFDGPDRDTLRDTGLEGGPRAFEASEGGWVVSLEASDPPFNAGDFGFGCGQPVEQLSLRVVDPASGSSWIRVVSADVDAVLEGDITVTGDALEGVVDALLPWDEATATGDCVPPEETSAITVFWMFSPAVRVRQAEVPDWAADAS